MLTINGDRLWDRLMEMARIGSTSQGGVCRVALTDEDRNGRDLFVRWCENIGCTVEIDQLGNIFARRSGQDNQAPAIMIGSHLDSQPTGGKFDGALGVLAGLEVLETLNDNNIITPVPIEVVSWTNEEGARFSPAMIASGVFSGNFTLDYAYSRTDKQKRTLGEELDRIGYQGTLEVGNRPYQATFELHIEQGPILEAEQKSVGIVTGVQGIRWYDLMITGQETHAGPSPMHYRRDPMMLAAKILPLIYEIAATYQPEAKVTIGYIDASPGVRNTVPGSLTIAVDLRHPNTKELANMDSALKNIVQKLSGEYRVTAELEEIWYSPPVKFDVECIDAVKRATEVCQIPAMEIVSGAGHDAVNIAKVAPTSMIFIPCKDGLSHNERESIKQGDTIRGANVLLNAVLQIASSNKVSEDEIVNKA